MFHKYFALPLMIVFAIAIGYGGGAHLGLTLHAQGNAAVKPYTMESDEFAIVDGTKILVARDTVSRRSDGALHKKVVHFAQPGHKESTFRSVQFPDGTVAGPISDLVRTKSTGLEDAKMVARENDSLHNLPANCLVEGETLDGEDSILGHPASRVVVTGTDPHSRTVKWHLRDLNCLVAQVSSESRASASAPWRATNYDVVTLISEGEPSPTLFTDWKAYDEVPPSETAHRLLRQDGLTPATDPSKFQGDQTDVRYAAMHKALIAAPDKLKEVEP